MILTARAASQRGQIESPSAWDRRAASCGNCLLVAWLYWPHAIAPDGCFITLVHFKGLQHHAQYYLALFKRLRWRFDASQNPCNSTALRIPTI